MPSIPLLSRPAFIAASLAASAVNYKKQQKAEQLNLQTDNKSENSSDPQETQRKLNKLDSAFLPLLGHNYELHKDLLKNLEEEKSKKQNNVSDFEDSSFRDDFLFFAGYFKKFEDDLEKEIAKYKKNDEQDEEKYIEIIEKFFLRFLQDWERHKKYRYDDAGIKNYYTDDNEKLSKQNDEEEKDPLRRIAGFSTSVAQAVANSFARQVANNAAMFVSQGGLDYFYKILTSNPESFYNGFIARVPYNFAAIIPAIFLAEQSVGISEEKKEKEGVKNLILQLSLEQRMQAIAVGGVSEAIFGASFEIAAMYQNYFSEKAMQYFRNNGVSHVLSELSDGEFWRVVKEFGEQDNKQVLKLYNNQDIKECLQKNGADFSRYEALCVENEKEALKELRKIFNDRKFATLIAEKSNMSNISFNSKEVRETLMKKFEPIKLNFLDCSRIALSSSFYASLRNVPLFWTMFCGIDKSVSLSAGLGAVSSIPASMANFAALAAAGGSNVFDAVKKGFTGTVNQIKNDPKAMALSAATRIIANLVAMVIFNQENAKDFTDMIYDQLTELFGVKKLPQKEMTEIDSVVVKAAEENKKIIEAQNSFAKTDIDVSNLNFGRLKTEEVNLENKTTEPSKEVKGAKLDEQKLGLLII